MSGSVPAANYIQFPKSKGPILGLTGQFLYLQVLFTCSMSLGFLMRKIPQHKSLRPDSSQETERLGSTYRCDRYHR